MQRFIMAESHGRVISGKDKIFGINKMAQDMAKEIGFQKVANGTIGTLLDDKGNLMILPSVAKEIQKLNPWDFAEYAPIAGLPSYLEAVKKAVFMDYEPDCCISAVATPGGTGAIRNAIQNYTQEGDTILTSDWHWGPYNIISSELGRKLSTYTLFDDENKYNIASLDNALNDLLKEQNKAMIILNTPSHNPTGYTLSLEDWDNLLEVLTRQSEKKAKKIILLIDVAYMDFAGDPLEAREFFTKLSNLNENILTLIAFSMSKSYTAYGMRSGALLCLSSSSKIAEEFSMVNSFSSRGTWSNGNRAAMVVLSNIFSDKKLYTKVNAERQTFVTLLKTRATVFTDAMDKAGLEMCPYSCGFFAVVLCDKAEKVATEAMKDGVFTVPMGDGIRVSLASLSEEKCKQIPGVLARAIETVKAADQ